MKRLILTAGLPGCGKSTWARKFQKKHKSYLIVNKDLIRLMLTNKYWDEKCEKLVHPIANSIVEELLHANKNIIIDETCCRKSFRDHFRFLAETSGHRYEIICVYFKISKKECLRRNRLRDKKVDDWVIDKIAKIFQSPKKSEKFDKLIVFNNKTLLSNAVQAL